MDGRQLYLDRASSGGGSGGGGGSGDGGGRPRFQRTYHYRIVNALHFLSCNIWLRN